MVDRLSARCRLGNGAGAKPTTSTTPRRIRARASVDLSAEQGSLYFPSRLNVMQAPCVPVRSGERSLAVCHATFRMSPSTETRPRYVGLVPFADRIGTLSRPGG